MVLKMVFFLSMTLITKLDKKELRVKQDNSAKEVFEYLLFALW